MAGYEAPAARGYATYHTGYKVLERTTDLCKSKCSVYCLLWNPHICIFRLIKMSSSTTRHECKTVYHPKRQDTAMKNKHGGEYLAHQFLETN